MDRLHRALTEQGTNGLVLFIAGRSLWTATPASTTFGWETLAALFKRFRNMRLVFDESAANGMPTFPQLLSSFRGQIVQSGLGDNSRDEMQFVRWLEDASCVVLLGAFVTVHGVVRSSLEFVASHCNPQKAFRPVVINMGHPVYASTRPPSNVRDVFPVTTSGLPLMLSPSTQALQGTTTPILASSLAPVQSASAKITTITSNSIKNSQLTASIQSANASSTNRLTSSPTATMGMSTAQHDAASSLAASLGGSFPMTGVKLDSMNSMRNIIRQVNSMNMTSQSQAMNSAVINGVSSLRGEGGAAAIPSSQAMTNHISAVTSASHHQSKGGARSNHMSRVVQNAVADVEVTGLRSLALRLKAGNRVEHVRGRVDHLLALTLWTLNQTSDHRNGAHRHESSSDAQVRLHRYFSAQTGTDHTKQPIIPQEPVTTSNKALTNQIRAASPPMKPEHDSFPPHAKSQSGVTGTRPVITSWKHTDGLDPNRPIKIEHTVPRITPATSLASMASSSADSNRLMTSSITSLVQQIRPPQSVAVIDQPRDMNRVQEMDMTSSAVEIKQQQQAKLPNSSAQVTWQQDPSPQMVKKISLNSLGLREGPSVGGAGPTTGKRFPATATDAVEHGLELGWLEGRLDDTGMEPALLRIREHSVWPRRTLHQSHAHNMRQLQAKPSMLSQSQTGNNHGAPGGNNGASLHRPVLAPSSTMPSLMTSSSGQSNPGGGSSSRVPVSPALTNHHRSVTGKRKRSQADLALYDLSSISSVCYVCALGQPFTGTTPTSTNQQSTFEATGTGGGGANGSEGRHAVKSNHEADIWANHMNQEHQKPRLSATGVTVGGVTGGVSDVTGGSSSDMRREENEGTLTSRSGVRCSDKLTVKISISWLPKRVVEYLRHTSSKPEAQTKQAGVPANTGSISQTTLPNT
uniref:Uncharacterized protein n=1 Tax=Octactis speculum TaxID=3111310 RepID=A0A7S2AZ44_9STRA|mmetsp:Transcript_17649/g.23816  ORF Transcript_17649/g.23816 Transcript_17649/m.23816 type:complete len:917 (+) Transcript_17649:136-2886(+)|eukprot:CAMPEP_0185746436 /NCGR_PEP_ID=MMETSP1174-20130828/4986_1 /TAXON_ID=35687 /ORGANISM="Dictyocha speculum, Strain CCMP1381" /LENGTH=916 /DNA_ID=CAMNT_0028421113 /DNA_START=134 /DNA_END=2884 /DNA_ORIENTATION=-